jgi:radical SAM superfamily enzyme YgiQ (UPF0313 family)
MNNKLLLVNPSNIKRDDKYPPLSLIWLASFLEAHGYVVDILEANALDMTFEETVAAIEASDADVCGFTFMTPQANYVSDMIREIKSKKPGLILIAGGVHVSIVPENFLEQCPEIDFLVIGEGEYSTLELLDALRSNRVTDSIAGIGFRKDNEIVITPRRSLIENLDDLPMPAWEKLPINNYEVMTPERVSDPTKGSGLTISSERGCPFECTFCASGSVYGKSYRSRSPLKTVEEIEYITKKFNISNFFFVDEVLTFSEDSILELCRLINEKKLQIRWSCNSRCNAKGLTDRAMSAMKEAGCIRLDFGIESGSPKVLKSIKKGIKLHNVYNAFKLAHDHGLYTTALMIVCLPDENLDDIRLSLRLNLNIESEILLFGAATPFPGTALYSWALNNNYLNTYDWSEYYICNRRPVMRTESFDETRINELVDYVYSVAQILSKLSDAKRHYSLSITVTARLYLSLILEVKSFISFADKVSWIKMFLMKRTNENYVMSTLKRLEFECKPLDNYSFHLLSEDFIKSLISSGHTPELLFVYDEAAYSIPHFIQLLQTHYGKEFRVRLTSKSGARLDEIKESDNISYGPADAFVTYDAAFYFADRNLNILGLLKILASIVFAKFSGKVKRQFVASLGLKIYEASLQTVIRVASGIFGQSISILSIPFTLIWLVILTRKTNEMNIKEKFLPTYLHDESF